MLKMDVILSTHDDLYSLRVETLLHMMYNIDFLLLERPVKFSSDSSGVQSFTLLPAWDEPLTAAIWDPVPLVRARVPRVGCPKCSRPSHATGHFTPAQSARRQIKFLRSAAVAP